MTRTRAEDAVRADGLRTRAWEAAAEAHPEPWPGMVPMAQFSYAEGYAAGYLAHAAQQPTRDIDVDELARVIGSVHKRETETYGQHDRRRARTVRNYLLTGDESDE